MKTIGFICFGILLVLNGLGNNVRIVGSVKPSSMPSGNIVSVNLTRNGKIPGGISIITMLFIWC